MKILVTGGAGFIGSHLVESLVENGHDVTVLDNLSSGKPDNLSAVNDQITFVNGDIRDKELISSILPGIEVIYHLAAEVSVPASFNDPIKHFEINVLGTQNICEAAVKSNVERIIFASSSAVYGETSKLPITEETQTAPLSPYGMSKLMGEELLDYYYRVFGLKSVIFRYFNIYGPRQDAKSEYSAVISKFISLIQGGKNPVIFGDGSQSRDFIYVSDVVKYNLNALKLTSHFAKPINIGTGKPVTIKGIVEKLAEIFEKEITPVFDNPREGDIRHSYCNNNIACKELSIETTVDLLTGLHNLLKNGYSVYK